LSKIQRSSGWKRRLLYQSGRSRRKKSAKKKSSTKSWVLRSALSEAHAARSPPITAS
jgi:hypothetical protein